MKRTLPIVLLLAAACSGADSGTTTTTTEVTTTSTLAVSTTAPPVECPPPPYELGFLPVGVGTAVLDAAEIEPDVWTSVPGSSATLWGREDAVAIALIRGALPAVEWPGDKGEVSIDGTEGVAGPHPDGTWVAGWFEAPGERCDLYTMVLYPPIAPADVEQTLAGMNRVGG
ncbi:MAG: hypothetical protein ACRDXF_08045 [Acidimicrobiia bacterium]